MGYHLKFWTDLSHLIVIHTWTSHIEEHHRKKMSIHGRTSHILIFHPFWRETILIMSSGSQSSSSPVCYAHRHSDVSHRGTIAILKSKERGSATCSKRHHSVRSLQRLLSIWMIGKSQSSHCALRFWCRWRNLWRIYSDPTHWNRRFHTKFLRIFFTLPSKTHLGLGTCILWPVAKPSFSFKCSFVRKLIAGPSQLMIKVLDLFFNEACDLHLGIQLELLAREPQILFASSSIPLVSRFFLTYCF